MLKFSQFLLFSIPLFLPWVQCFQVNTQEFTLFTEPYPESQSCTPTASTCLRRSFSDNLKDLGALWEPISANTVKSWCSVSQGMWLFYSEPAFSRNSSYHGFVKTGRPPHPGSSVSQCVNFQGSQRIQSIRHFSHANLSTPAISLFTRELSATGGSILQRELFLDGDSISLSTPISFGAYAFSGFRPWTIYPLPGFAGSPTCLNLPRDFDPTSDAREMALLSVNINVNLILASARVGCSGSATHLFPLPSKTAVLSLGDSLTLFLERGHPHKRNVSMVTPTPQENSTTPSFILDVESSSNSTLPVFFSGLELVLPSTFWVSGFTPDNSLRNGSSGDWELCSDLDFTGSCLCLRANSTKTTFNQSLAVLSARFGCPGVSPHSGEVPQVFIHLEVAMVTMLLLSVLM